MVDCTQFKGLTEEKHNHSEGAFQSPQSPLNSFHATEDTATEKSMLCAIPKAIFSLLCYYTIYPETPKKQGKKSFVVGSRNTY
jgi:5,10-methylene-tetrahydrofolate dehydrogenase/methenyl tetrahydrofolate cyclohydrolase